MNISKFVVLGALESLETASGYDIVRFLEKKMISNWTDIKKGSIYNSLKSLCKNEEIVEVERLKNGLFPTMTLYQVTEKGRQTFDELQEEAFMGLYPKFFGFKLALKFNRRLSHQDIHMYAEAALERIENILAEMDSYLESLPADSQQFASDAFYIEHDRILFLDEKKWINMVIEKLHLSESTSISGL